MATLLDTTDAMVWAQEFCRIFNGKRITQHAEMTLDIDEGTMVGWFANAIETGRNHQNMPDSMGPYQAFLHFYHLDKSNAALHTAEARFSPITFRLQEFMVEAFPVEASQDSLISEVMGHNGKYREDRGR